MRVTRKATLGITRLPTAAGLYYPRDARKLRHALRKLLRAPGATSAQVPKALVVPHSAYELSGDVAAAAYRSLQHAAGLVRHVVLVGPTHRSQSRALAMPSCKYFATPCGIVPVYEAGRERLRERGLAGIDDGPHELEHSLEVQLPFLQEQLEDFDILPIAVGAVLPEQVVRALEAVWGGRETLVVVSSDLSHHHTYAEAAHLDEQTAATILARRSDLSDAQACGAVGINGLMAVARHKSLEVRLLDRGTSGDASGDQCRVVGFGSFALFETPGPESTAANPES